MRNDLPIIGLVKIDWVNSCNIMQTRSPLSLSSPRPARRRSQSSRAAVPSSTARSSTSSTKPWVRLESLVQAFTFIVGIWKYDRKALRDVGTLEVSKCADIPYKNVACLIFCCPAHQIANATFYFIVTLFWPLWRTADLDAFITEWK